MAAIFEQCFSISLRKMQVFVCYWCCSSIGHSSIQTTQTKGRAVLICCPFCLCCRTSYRLQLNEGLNVCICMHYTSLYGVCDCEDLQFTQFQFHLEKNCILKLFLKQRWGNGPQLCLARSWLIICALDLRVAWIDLSWSCWGYLKIMDS